MLALLPTPSTHPLSCTTSCLTHCGVAGGVSDAAGDGDGVPLCVRGLWEALPVGSLPENRFTMHHCFHHHRTSAQYGAQLVFYTLAITAHYGGITVVLQWHHSGTQCHTVHRSARD